MRVKYPRTPHLPWSPGATADDVRLVDLRALEGREVVVTEKLDGENTTLYRDGLHARSLDSAHHPSRSRLKALHGRVASQIPEGWRVCGENVFARHSIEYRALEGCFYAFSVWAAERCLSWDETVRFTTERLGVPTPRVLHRGIFDARALRKLKVERDRVEGYVVRLADGFAFADFEHSVAKWVRSEHVTTDAHWMQSDVVPNGLSDRAALWEVRSGGASDVEGLLRALGIMDAPSEGAEIVAAHLDARGRRGDARLAGVLACTLSSSDLRDEGRRSWLAPRLVAPLGMRLARTVADLVGRRRAASWEVPDAARVAQLRRLARGTGVAALAALAHVATDPQQAELFELFADEAGVLREAPFEHLRAPLDAALAGEDPDVRDHAWAAILERFTESKLQSPEEALAIAHPMRRVLPPRLVITVGPSGSGKSTFADRLGCPVISLDRLRAARGDRADQSDNDAVLRRAVDLLEAAMRAGGQAVWDATALDPRQRGIPLRAARRHGALVTFAVFLAPDEQVLEQNGAREHAVPDAIVRAQLARRVLPHAGEADRILYIDARGEVADISGSLDDRAHAELRA